MRKKNVPPNTDFQIKEVGGKQFIYDLRRRKYVQLTREEWVRQHFIRYLIAEKGYPRARIAVETSIPQKLKVARSDVLVYDNDGRALLLAECKAPEIAVSAKTVDQISRYNAAIGAPLLVVTNGKTTLCWRFDAGTKSYVALNKIPAYAEITEVQ